MNRNIISRGMICVFCCFLPLQSLSSESDIGEQNLSGHYLEFKSIIVNLSHQETRVYLTLNIGFSLKESSDKGRLRAREIEIRREIIKAAQRQGYGSLQQSEGRLLFREKIERIIVSRLPDRHLLQLFFLTFIVD